jgi:hypothetical protein
MVITVTTMSEMVGNSWCGRAQRDVGLAGLEVSMMDYLISHQNRFVITPYLNLQHV